MQQYIEQVIAERRVTAESILQGIAENGQWPVEAGAIGVIAGPVIGGEDLAEVGAVHDGVVADGCVVVEHKGVV